MFPPSLLLMNKYILHAKKIGYDSLVSFLKISYTVLGPNRQVELFCTWLIWVNMDRYMLDKIPYVVFKICSAFGVRK